MKQPNKTAVLVIDMVNDYFADGPLKDRRSKLVSAINTLVNQARTQGLPVIWIRQEFSPDLSDGFLIMRKKNIPITIAGTDGCKLLSDLDYRPSDYEIIKKRYSAFFETNLDELIASLGIERLIICGINTHACIRMATIDAYQRDLEVIIPKECVDSPDLEHHEVSLRYLGDEISQIIPLEDLIGKMTTRNEIK